MDIHESDDLLSAVNMSRQQAALSKQLFQVIITMHHIDELFQWLAYALIQHFDVQLLLFWTNHISPTGQLVAQLRTIAHRDLSFPQQIIVNDQTQRIAQRLISERATYKLQPVENLFSSYQTILLRRYGLPYWGSCFTSSNTLLPPRADAFSQGESPVFFAMTTLLFVKQIPQFNIVSTTNTILEEVTRLAERRGLLLPTVNPNTPIPPYFPQFSSNEKVAPPIPQAPLKLTQLIPSRIQNADLLLANNPFARPATIADKKARKLHTAIDGRANVAELCSLTGLNIQEASIALRLLWGQQRIEIHEPSGKPIDLSLFLNDY